MNGSQRLSYLKLDICDEKGCIRVFEEFKPEEVIHSASIGSPDYAEKNKNLTRKVNVAGTKNIVRLCERFYCKLIYISSNGIYDGENAPYAEEDKVTPINFYGETKLQGEEISKKTKVPCAIVRPILMYGWNNNYERPNIVTLAIEKLAKREKMFVYQDVYTNPLYVASCAEAIWAIIEKNKYEVFNIAGKERISVYGLVRKAAEIFGLDQDLIIPVKQGYFNELVPRPKDTSYKTEKMEKILQIKPLLLEEGLKQMRSAKE